METLSSIVKEGAYGMSEIVGAVMQIVKIALDSLEFGQTGKDFRDPSHRPSAGRTHEAGCAGTHAFDRFSTGADFFHINAGSEIFGHDGDPVTESRIDENTFIDTVTIGTDCEADRARHQRCHPWLASTGTVAAT
jgi:hypothetical protein